MRPTETIRRFFAGCPVRIAPLDGNCGYASLTAIVLCAAVSSLCAGALTLALSQKKAEAHQMQRLQQAEAINSAVLQFAGDIVTADAAYSFTESKTIATSAGAFTVKLTAQSEYAKWPLTKVGDVSEASLAKSTTLTRDVLLDLIARHRGEDCVRSLFSDLGQAAVDKDLPRSKGALYTSSAKDGQVWRIRAVSGAHVEERRVRFLGDPRHLFALMSIERTSLGEMPECQDLKS